MSIFFSILEQSLLFLPFALGVLLSYGILKKADLTVEGSFVLGAGVYAKGILLADSALFATIASLLAGSFAGAATSSLQYKNRVSPLLSGTLVLFSLQSLNLIGMGRPNLNILGKASFFNALSDDQAFALLLLQSFCLLLAMYFLLCSRTGMLLKAFGCDAKLLELLGKNAELYRFLGLSASNALVAYSGALTAQAYGYADISMGTGLVLVGIASTIIGMTIEKLFSSKSVFLKLFSCSLAVFSYFCMIQVFLSFGLHPLYLKMFVGISLAFIFFFQGKSYE